MSWWSKACKFLLKSIPIKCLSSCLCPTNDNVRFKCQSECSQKLCCFGAWCVLLYSGRGWSRRLRVQKWRAEWSLPCHYVMACSDFLQIKLWGYILSVTSTYTGDLFSNLSQVLNHVSSSSPELAEICMIETSMRTFSITVMGVRKPAPSPLRLPKSLILFTLFHLQWSEKGILSEVLDLQNVFCSLVLYFRQCHRAVLYVGGRGGDVWALPDWGFNIPWSGVNEGNSKGNSKNIWHHFCETVNWEGGPSPWDNPTTNGVL